MSKYILVVDLPDDSKCRGCPLFNEEQSTCPEMEELIDMNVWENPMNWNRNKNSDCPLIPVDRVMKSIDDMSDTERTIDYYDLMRFVRDELGVSE